MALVKCPECGREVSDTAGTCPGCGYSLNTKKRELPVKKIGIVSGVAIVIVVCIIIIFSVNKLSETEQADVDRVVAAITSIEEVSLTSESKIIEAEKLYNELSAKCQRHVGNHKELSDARDTYNNLKAEETIDLINQIGTVSLDSQKKIDKAQKSYDELSDEQKELVSNAENLSSAINELSDLRIDDVDLKISDIGTVTLDSKEKIEEARSSYDELSDDDKSKVSKYNDLEKAESDYESLAVSTCMSLIDGIGAVTLESKEKIDEAKKIYQTLSKETREKVTNYVDLTSAEDTYTQLAKEEEERQNTLNPGDTFSTAKWEVTYTKTNISAKILPNNTSGAYLYYYAEDDETFVDIVFQIKNVNTDILGIEDMVGTCKIEYDGSNLTKSYGLYTSSGSNIDAVYSWDGLDALDSTTLHVAIRMPREVQTNDKSITVKLMIAGQEKIIHVR